MTTFNYDQRDSDSDSSSDEKFDDLQEEHKRDIPLGCVCCSVHPDFIQHREFDEFEVQHFLLAGLRLTMTEVMAEMHKHLIKKHTPRVMCCIGCETTAAVQSEKEKKETMLFPLFDTLKM